MMDFLADIAGGSGIFGSIIGVVGGIASAFVKLKTLKETNRHSFVMSELAGNQEVARAEAALKVVQVEGAIKTDLAIEESLQESFKHDASMGAWLRGRELGKFATAVLATAEFVRMMMRPVLTLWATIYVFRMYGWHITLASQSELPVEILSNQMTMVGAAILLLATTGFTWWFADRSVSKALTKKLVG